MYTIKSEKRFLPEDISAVFHFGHQDDSEQGGKIHTVPGKNDNEISSNLKVT